MAEHVYEEQITIDAPAAAVWAVLVDVERWPRWTASVRAVSLLGPAPLQVGSKVRVRQPRMPAMTQPVRALIHSALEAERGESPLPARQAGRSPARDELARRDR